MGNSFKALISFQIRNGSFIPRSSLGTAILGYDVREDSLVVNLENSYTTSIYSYFTDNPYVAELTTFTSKFKMVVEISGNVVVIKIKDNLSDRYISLRDMYSSMTLGFVCVMDLALDPSTTIHSTKAINNNYTTIQSRDNIGNINVYVNDNGRTNYYDNQLPITVDMGTMVFNNINGEYTFPITLKKLGTQYNVITLFPYVLSSSYSNNIITLTCTQSANGFILGKITSATVGVPYQLVINPTYSSNIISININGTRLDNIVTDFTINMTLAIAIL